MMHGSRRKLCLTCHTLDAHIARTGVYFLKQWPGGKAFMEEWLRWYLRQIGHDQDGLNTVVSGLGCCAPLL